MTKKNFLKIKVDKEITSIEKKLDKYRNVNYNPFSFQDHNRYFLQEKLNWLKLFKNLY